jgi:hypothetical protein
MKALVTYYSRGGSNKRIAEELASKLGCDIDEIKGKRYSFLGLIKGAYRAGKKKPDEALFEKDPAEYDTVIFAYPLWAGRMPPSVRGYLLAAKGIKSASLVSVSSGGPANKKALEDIEEALGKQLSSVLFLKSKELKSGKYKEALKAFSEGLV